MANRRKPKKVDHHYDYHTGITLEFYLELDNTFSVRVFGETFRHADFEALKNQAVNYLRDNLNVEFRPIIHVERIKPFAREDGSFVGFDVDRLYYAAKPNKELLQVPWDVVEHRKIANNRKELLEFSSNWNPSRWHVKAQAGIDFIPPISLDEENVFLPYTEETWVGLENMQKAISELNVRLNELIRSAEGQEQIAEIGAAILKMLPAGIER